MFLVVNEPRSCNNNNVESFSTSLELCTPTTIAHMEESEAAAPILGSSLLAATFRNGPPTNHFVGTGVPAIDEQTLRGGFRCGELTSIAGGVDTEKSIVQLR